MDQTRRGPVIKRFIVLTLLAFFTCGTAWADCAQPTAPRGHMIFNADAGVVQYCNGANWVPFPKQTVQSGWKQISVGELWSDPFACGLTHDGSAWCWGRDHRGQLGNGAALTANQSLPSPVAGGHRWKQISAGRAHVCGIRTDDVAMCWGGHNDDWFYGMLGDGAGSGNQPEPVLVAGGHLWSKISAGGEHSCGIRTDGVAMCWGRDWQGALGNGAGGDNNAPGIVLGGHSWTDISAGGNYTCGVTTSGDGYCWGRAENGILGNGTTTPNVQTPSLVLGGHNWRSINASDWQNTCGVTTGGVGYCWGEAWDGKLGNGTTTPNVSAPSLVLGGHDWQDIDPGTNNSCGLTTGNALYCWGSNAWGVNGTGTSPTSPALVNGGHSWINMSVGGSSACGIRTDGTAMCWGRGNTGAIGNGTTPNDQQFPATVGSATNACDLGTWSANPITPSPNKIVYGNGRFLSLSSPTMTSTDGVNWTATPTAISAYDAVYGNGQWVAVNGGWNRDVYTSSDGLTWTAHANATPNDNQWHRVAYGNGRYAAVVGLGSGNKIMSSTNGTTWTGHAAPDRVWWDIAYGNGRFVVLAYHGAETAVSTDGINWTVQGIAGVSSNHGRAIAFGNGIFVAVYLDGSDRIITSPDGINWTARTVPELNEWEDVAFYNGRFVAVSNNGTNRVVTSTDGITWTPYAAAEQNSWRWLAGGNGRFVAASNDGTNRTMTASCISSCTNPDEPAGSIIYNNAQRVMQWCDGTNWQAAGPVNPGGPAGGCSSPSGAGGDIVYNSTSNVAQYCDGGAWRGIGKPDTCTTPGSTCPDGSIYVGLSPDGYRKMYTTTTHGGNHRWNDNVTNENTMTNCTAIGGAPATCRTGFNNSVVLANLAATYQAAEYCRGLSSFGHTDWYLPALDELQVMYLNRASLPGMDTQYYWSSSQHNNTNARYIDFNNGTSSFAGKNQSYRVRCVRKD